MRRASVAVLLFVLGCRTQQESPERAGLRMLQEAAAAQTAIDAVNIRYMRFMNGNMADSVATLFTEDAVLMPPGSRAIEGREEIRKFFAENPLPPGGEYTFMAVDVKVNGPMLVERGEYNLSLPAEGRTPAVSINGKYLVHWRSVGGYWLQVATIWNENTQP